MRSTLRLLTLMAVLCAPLAAQEPKQATPFVFSIGPAWTQSYHLSGLQLRGEYTFVRYRWFGLQLDAGGFWSPSQSYSARYIDGTTLDGWGQAIHLHLGLAGTVTPFPRARLSPYGLIGIAAVQSWSTGSTYYRPGDGSPPYYFRGSGTSGKFDGFLGVGLRLRLGSRPVQIEMRHFGDRIKAFTIGTALHF